MEWHKREYRAALKGPWKERAINLGKRVLGKKQSFSHSVDQFEKEEEHRQALIRLGYLEKREFALSNRSIDHVIHEGSRIMRGDRRWSPSRHEFVHVEVRRTNVMVIVAERSVMPVFADAIRKADVPEAAK